MQLWSPPQNDPQRAMTLIKDMKLEYGITKFIRGIQLGEQKTPYLFAYVLHLFLENTFLSLPEIGTEIPSYFYFLFALLIPTGQLV